MHLNNIEMTLVFIFCLKNKLLWPHFFKLVKNNMCVCTYAYI